MTTGRINQVTIFSGGPSKRSPRHTLQLSRAEQFTERWRAYLRCGSPGGTAYLKDGYHAPATKQGGITGRIRLATVAYSGERGYNPYRLLSICPYRVPHKAVHHTHPPGARHHQKVRYTPHRRRMPVAGHVRDGYLLRPTPKCLWFKA